MRAIHADPVTVYLKVWASKATLTRVYEQRTLLARAAVTAPKAAAILDQLTDRRRRAVLLFAPTPTDEATRKQRDADLARYYKDIESLNRELRLLFPAVERTEKLANPLPTDLQKVLHADAAVVDFLRWIFMEQDSKKPGEEGQKRTVRYMAFIVTKNKVSWLDPEKAESINAWREAITAGTSLRHPLSGNPADPACWSARSFRPQRASRVSGRAKKNACRFTSPLSLWLASGDPPSLACARPGSDAAVPRWSTGSTAPDPVVTGAPPPTATARCPRI